MTPTNPPPAPPAIPPAEATEYPVWIFEAEASGILTKAFALAALAIWPQAIFFVPLKKHTCLPFENPVELPSLMIIVPFFSLILMTSAENARDEIKNRAKTPVRNLNIGYPHAWC